MDADTLIGRFYSHEALIDYAENLEAEADKEHLDPEDRQLWLEEALAARARAVQLETE